MCSVFILPTKETVIMKKEVKAIIAIVLAVWILVMGIEIGSIREKKKAASVNNTTTQTTTAPTTTEPTTTEPTTTAPTTTQPTVSQTPGTSDTTTTAPSAPSAADPSAMSKEEVVGKVVEYVNKVKAEQNMTAHKTENITVNLTSLSAESLKNPVNSVISGIVGEPTDEVITVVNGTATYPDGSTRPVKEAIPPSNDATKDFALSADGVASYKAEKQGDNTVYTVVLVAESTTATSPIPPHNSKAIGYLNLMGLDLPSGVTITDSTMEYPGSTVEVTVNTAGQVIKLVNKMPMTGYGAAKIAFASGTANFEGALDEVWEFTY